MQSKKWQCNVNWLGKDLGVNSEVFVNATEQHPAVQYISWCVGLKDIAALQFLTSV